MCIWFRSFAAKYHYKSAVIIFDLVTFIAACHYIRNFDSCIDEHLMLMRLSQHARMRLSEHGQMRLSEHGEMRLLQRCWRLKTLSRHEYRGLQFDGSIKVVPTDEDLVERSMKSA